MSRVAGTPAEGDAELAAMVAADRSAVDPEGLARFLAAEVPALDGPFVIERLGEGQSCLTFLVRGGGWDIVLRRPPRGDLPPSAFDVTREYRVMHALRTAGAHVPVPKVLALCEDRDVIGAPFYLMERVDGVVVRGELPDELSSLGDRGAMATRLVDTLTALRAVDIDVAGLASFGRPDGYLERQLWRMRGLWDMARFRDVPEIDEVGAWLAEHLPQQRPAAIVHGDYKLDNVMFAPRLPVELVAVVDWEQSTIGDPLVDLGWVIGLWMNPGERASLATPSPFTDGMDVPTRADLIARYARQTDRDLTNLAFYCVLGLFKLACVMEGSYARFKAGTSDDQYFAALEVGVPALAQRALEFAKI
jgi:aminoglycoside phosphotransferase (APT) family kinase protein